MEHSVVIAQLDSVTMAWLAQEAERTGLSIEAVAARLIYRGLEAENRQLGDGRHHDLDALAGTWSDEEADEFRQTIADLERVDPSLWQ